LAEKQKLDFVTKTARNR